MDRPGIAFVHGPWRLGELEAQQSASPSTDISPSSVVAVAGIDMFLSTPPVSPPAVIAKSLMAHSIGVCDVVDLSPQSKSPDYYGLSPTTDAQSYFSDLNLDNTHVTVVNSPRHGAFQSDPVGDWTMPGYIPDEGYTGHDKFALSVSDGKYNIVIYYDLEMTNNPDAGLTASPTCLAPIWKISSALRESGQFPRWI